jgi:hypothetical protein
MTKVVMIEDSSRKGTERRVLIGEIEMVNGLLIVFIIHVCLTVQIKMLMLKFN